MTTPPVRLAAFAGAALVLAGAVVLALPARSQINAAPSWVPIGVAASGNASTAWFHEPGSRQAVACLTVAKPGGGGLAAIECVAGRLP